MSALAGIRDSVGLEAYLEGVEDRLASVVASHPGVVADVGAEALAAGGKRLRPLLCFLSSAPGREPPLEAGVAVELVHMATLVHDDLIDGAQLRRGRETAWSAHGAAAARAAGDHLFARAFAELASTGDAEGTELLANAALCLVRGEAMQRRQAYEPDTPVEAYYERCTLKTGKLFEVTCLLGAGARESELGRFALALGIAFQITDDILDCTGETIETGKVPGTDLREGTPTLPLLLAAREDPVVRRALAGGPLEGVLVRVAATSALERSRAVARDYAERACSSLDGHGRREELEALTNAVVERER